MTARLTKILDAQCRLGESPVWLANEGVLAFVDITGRLIHRYNPLSGAHSRHKVDEDVASIAPCREGGFIAGLRSGVWRLHADGAKRAMVCPNPEDVRVNRFNDGKVDPLGRYILGTMDETKLTGAAGLYRLDSRGLVRLAGGLMTSNGVAFSPSGAVLYHADTPRFSVWRRPYDVATGEVGPEELFIRLDPAAPDRARPDGAAVDAAGGYWAALYDGGRVERYDPEGRLTLSVPLDARRPTMPAFGGADLKTLFVTTARDEEGGGGLYAIDVEAPGLSIPPFDPTV